MLNISQIEQYYPEHLRAFKKNILREYLQYQILEIIFNSKIAKKLSFLGGTALRILYDNARFSEDLDFDNFDLNQNDFSLLTKEVQQGLEKHGYKVEIRNVFKGAYRCYIKIPKVLFDNDITNMEEEKIMIQIDTLSNNFKYKPDNKILNKFDVFTQIAVTPLDILLSQKIYAALNRKRAKGRDFFDIVFLFQKTKPNYEYLKKKLEIKDELELKSRLIKQVNLINLEEIAKDVEPFLFNPSDSKKVTMFGEYIKYFSQEEVSQIENILNNKYFQNTGYVTKNLKIKYENDYLWESSNNDDTGAYAVSLDLTYNSRPIDLFIEPFFVKLDPKKIAEYIALEIGKHDRNLKSPLWRNLP